MYFPFNFTDHHLPVHNDRWGSKVPDHNGSGSH